MEGLLSLNPTGNALRWVERMQGYGGITRYRGVVGVRGDFAVEDVLRNAQNIYTL